MKTILATMVLTVSTLASAATHKLPAKSTALTLLTQGNVTVETSVPKCPPNAMCEAVSVLKVNFTLNGCMDKLGPVTIKEIGYTPDGKKKFVVTAYNINNEASTYTKCFRAPIGIASQVIGLGFLTTDSVEVEFAQNTAKSETF